MYVLVSPSTSHIICVKKRNITFFFFHRLVFLMLCPICLLLTYIPISIRPLGRCVVTLGRASGILAGSLKNPSSYQQARTELFPSIPQIRANVGPMVIDFNRAALGSSARHKSVARWLKRRGRRQGEGRREKEEIRVRAESELDVL